MTPGQFTYEQVSKRRNIINEATKKAEKKAGQIEPESKAAELSDKDLDNVAGGKTYLKTRSNTS